MLLDVVGGGFLRFFEDLSVLFQMRNSIHTQEALLFW